MDNAKRIRYVVVKDYHFARPTVYILDDITYEELCDFIKKKAVEEYEADIQKGWESKIDELDEDYYIVTTKTDKGRVLTVDITKADDIVDERRIL